MLSLSPFIVFLTPSCDLGGERSLLRTQPTATLGEKADLLTSYLKEPVLAGEARGGSTGGESILDVALRAKTVSIPSAEQSCG